MPAADTVREMYSAMASGNIDGALSTLADDVHWTEAEGFPYAGTYVGPQAVAEQVFARLGADWDGFAAVPDVLIGEDQQVAALGWYSGTSRETGVAFRARFVHWFTVADGRIARFEQVCDTAQVAVALQPAR
jgi:ketosteroid isomerase-like protein